ncbi:MAG: hypothetical protein J7K00_02260 [Candidatus Diapherotrites archaeon]|nr:hypothetical protein [Candidatus Diapherotrites archaeon]
MKLSGAINKNFSRILILGLLIFVLVLILVSTHIVSCRAIPGFCGVYESFFGKPDVLIVYGDDGMGDERVLYDTFVKRLNVFPESMHVKIISPGYLEKYELVIVTHAKTMSVQQIKSLMDYALKGGRLVWIGDAGTGFPQGESPVYLDDIEQCVQEPSKPLDCPEHELLNPWVRKDSNRVYRLDYLLNSEVIGYFSQDPNYFSGKMQIPDRSDPLVKGISSDLSLKTNFLVVKLTDVGQFEAGRKIVATVTTNASFEKDGLKYSDPFPVIISSGVGGGKRVVYYAFSPEELVKSQKWYSFIESIYYAMVY